jgi:hypothetical protein
VYPAAHLADPQGQRDQQQQPWWGRFIVGCACTRVEAIITALALRRLRSRCVRYCTGYTVASVAGRRSIRHYPRAAAVFCSRLLRRRCAVRLAAATAGAAAAAPAAAAAAAAGLTAAPAAAGSAATSAAEKLLQG